jgi:hypothetical protein
MTDVQRSAFDEKVKQKDSELQYTQAFTREELEAATIGLDGWNELTGKERNQRAEAGGNNKKLYKYCKRFYVVHVAGVGGVEEAVLVEREKDGSAPADLTKLRRVAAQEDWFEVIKEEHRQGGHCKGKALENRVNARYSRIPRWALEVRACMCACMMCDAQVSMLGCCIPLHTALHPFLLVGVPSFLDPSPS